MSNRPAASGGPAPDHDGLHYDLVAVSSTHLGIMDVLYGWDADEAHRELYTCHPVAELPSPAEYRQRVGLRIDGGLLRLFVLVQFEDPAAADALNGPSGGPSARSRTCPEPRFLGRIQAFDFNPRNHSAEFGYYLPPVHRGGGLGRLMARLFLDHMFSDGTLTLNKLYASTSAGNAASVGLLESLGFHLDGRMREHYWVGDERYDQLYYSMLCREWSGKDP